METITLHPIAGFRRILLRGVHGQTRKIPRQAWVFLLLWRRNRA